MNGNISNFNLDWKKIDLKLFSIINNNIKLIIKYIAAYFAKKAKPSNNPRITKFKNIGFSFIFKTWTNAAVHKNINRISVLSKKEDKLTEGNKKKVKAQQRASDES